MKKKNFIFFIFVIKVSAFDVSAAYANSFQPLPTTLVSQYFNPFKWDIFKNKIEFLLLTNFTKNIYSALVFSEYASNEKSWPICSKFFLNHIQFVFL